MSWISDALNRGDIANLWGGADKMDDKLLQRFRDEYGQRSNLGSELHADPRGTAAPPQQATPAMQSQQAPARDFSGASGNPFAGKAAQMGFSDYGRSPTTAPAMPAQRGGGNPQMMQQQSVAKALRDPRKGARYG